MKKEFYRSLILSLLLSCFFYNCYSQIEFVSERNGTITVSTQGTDKKIPIAMANAEKYVFYKMFYQGIPGSSLKTGLIDITEVEAEQKYKDYFEFFYKERYQDFITSTTQNGDIVKGKHHKKSIFFDITINMNALRKDLEDNQIIRKFGY